MKIGLLGLGAAPRGKCRVRNPSQQAAALLDEPVSPYDVSSQSIFSFQKKQIWFESRSAQSCGSVTAHCRLAKHSAAHSSVHETARHVHDHSKLRHKVGRDSGDQHGAPAIERTQARPDGGATLLNAQLVHPGLRPPSISPAIARLSGGCNCNYNCLSDTHRRATASVPSDELHGYY